MTSRRPTVTALAVGMADWTPVGVLAHRRTVAWLDQAAAIREAYAYEEASGWSEFSAKTLSLALEVSQPAAAAELVVALALGSLPRLERAARDGRLSEPHVKAVVTALEGCAPELVSQVVDDVLTRLRPDCVRTPRQWHEAVVRAVLRVDPAAAERRRKEARRGRRVRVTPAADGMAWVVALLAVEDALAVSRSLDERAADLRAQGDERSHDERCADVLVATLTGRAAADGEATDVPLALRDSAPEGTARRPRRRDLLADLVIPAAVATGSCDEPGELRGVGPVDAAHARELLHRPGTRVRALFVDPGTGEPLAHGRTWSVGTDLRQLLREVLASSATVPAAEAGYVPGRALAAVAMARDPRSVFPTSGVPAWRSDLDHRVPYDHAAPDRGGTTSTENLAPLDRSSHRLKQRGLGWSRKPDGRVRWKACGRRAYYRASSWCPPPPLAACLV